jgi:3D (Asp-Asp-Asp) domain-containing protein
MRPLLSRAFPLALCLIITACSSPRPLPKFERPIARTQIQHVRTTAYTDSESDHIQYSNHNALGGTLQYGPIHSAAADWSRWPAGTVFRIRETGELYRVDDYGWALSGTNTIDLYKPSRSAMNAWGVRRVTIENLQWGDPKASLSVLRQRSHYRHVQRMIAELNDRMDELQQPVPGMDAASASTMIAATSPSQQSISPVADLAKPAPTPIPATRRPIVVASAPPPQGVPRAVPVTSTNGVGSTGGFYNSSNGSRANGVSKDPFFNGTR